MEIKNKTIITLAIILASTMFTCFIIAAGGVSVLGDTYSSVMYGMDITMTIFWSIGSLGLAVLIGFKILHDSKLITLILAGVTAFFVLMHFIYICVLASQLESIMLLMLPLGALILFVVSILLTVFILPEVLSDIKKVIKNKPLQNKETPEIKETEVTEIPKE